jgi:serine/threonine-protein kinase
MSTTIITGSQTITFGGELPEGECPDELLGWYRSLVDERRLSWTEHLRLTRLLGTGGQGVVYLSDRRGTDNFTLPVAIKIFSPERFKDSRAYDVAMARIAHVGSKVAQIQQDNLVDVYNFLERHRIRLMEMEWIDGHDLSRLMTPEMLERVRKRVSNRRWEYINNVIVTSGPVHPRLKPGVAVEVVRECLAGLAALHREEIVHGDVKPSNIMLKRTGSAKIIDIGSAFDMNQPPPVFTCTPTYAAPEVLEGAECTPLSDLASLGYVLIEMLAGRPLFAGINDFTELLEAKRRLPQRLPSILPEEVTVNELLMNLCRGMVWPDPMRRYPSAEDADLRKEGAAEFHRQLVKGDLASEYNNEIRLWLEELD